MTKAPKQPAKKAPKKRKTPKISIYAKVSQDVIEKLDVIADKNGISRSAAAAIALSKFVETGI